MNFESQVRKNQKSLPMLLQLKKHVLMYMNQLFYTLQSSHVEISTALCLVDVYVESYLLQLE